MGYYENLKCGNCKYSFTGGYKLSNGFMKTYLGVPYIKCPECKTVNKTGFKPWSTFHWFEKIYHWTSVVFRTFLYSFAFPFMVVGFIVKLYFEIDSYPLIIGIAAPIGLALFTYYIIRECKGIDEIEQEYNNMT
jgi:hypothetical protein